MKVLDKIMIIVFAFMSGGSAVATYIAIEEYSKYQPSIHYQAVIAYGILMTILTLLVSITLINPKKEDENNETKDNTVF